MYVTFASFSLPPSYTGSSGASASAPFDDGGAFPATGVAFQLGDVEIPVRASLDSRFPLRLSNFSVRPAGATAGLRGDQPHELEGSVVADGLDDGAIVCSPTDGSARPTALASPQSTTSVSPCRPRMMLAGLRSRWITPRVWA